MVEDGVELESGVVVEDGVVVEGGVVGIDVRSITARQITHIIIL